MVVSRKFSPASAMQPAGLGLHLQEGAAKLGKWIRQGAHASQHNRQCYVKFLLIVPINDTFLDFQKCGKDEMGKVLYYFFLEIKCIEGPEQGPAKAEAASAISQAVCAFRENPDSRRHACENACVAGILIPADLQPRHAVFSQQLIKPSLSTYHRLIVEMGRTSTSIALDGLRDKSESTVP